MVEEVKVGLTKEEFRGFRGLGGQDMQRRILCMERKLMSLPIGLSLARVTCVHFPSQSYLPDALVLHLQQHF
jgi:hypothetical protein